MVTVAVQKYRSKLVSHKGGFKGLDEPEGNAWKETRRCPTIYRNRKWNAAQQEERKQNPVGVKPLVINHWICPTRSAVQEGGF